MGGYSSQGYYGQGRWASEEDALPIGVGILAIIMGILGFLVLVAGLILIAGSAGISLGALSVVVTFINQYIFTVGPFGQVILLLAGVATLAIATGLWHQEAWALWTCIVGIAIVEALLFFYLEPFSYLFIGLLVLYVYFLAVRQHFH